MITEQELVALQLKHDTDATSGTIIKDLFNQHDTTMMEKGVKYYNNENDIKQRRIYYYDKDGTRIEDKDAVNNKIPHNYHKLLVDQKVSYLLGNPPNISADPERLNKLLNEYLDEEWEDSLQELGKNSSNKGVDYLHPFIDESGKFDYVIIPAEQVIVVYDTEYQKNITNLIRIYPFYVNNRESYRAEWWTKNEVEYFAMNKSGFFEKQDPDEIAGGENPAPHYWLNGQRYGWGYVPFIPFPNNKECTPDIKFYYEHIDMIDLLTSDTGNDMTDVQKLIYVLRGYQGDSLKEFKENLRYYRVIKIDDPAENAGVDTLSVDIDIDAVERYLKRLEDNIFTFGQGVDTNMEKFGNAPSGVALEHLYHLLDLKSDIMARKFSFAIKKFCWFLIQYFRISGVYNAPQGAEKSINITYNKSAPTNHKEEVEIAEKSQGIISNKTIRTNHPWVSDEQQEKEQMEQEEEEEMNYIKLRDQSNHEED